MKQVKLKQSYIKIQHKYFTKPDGTFKTPNSKILCYFDYAPTTTEEESWKPAQIANNPTNAEILDLQGNVLRTINYTGLITCDENEVLTIDDVIADKLIAQGIMEEYV
jgi:hypothetical protein